MSQWKSIFNPAIRFMDRLRIPYKISVVGVIFSIPLLSFMSLLTMDMTHERNFLLLKIKGFHCTHSLSKLMAGMQEHRGLAAMYLSGDPTVRQRLLSTRAEVDSEMFSLLSLHKSENMSISNHSDTNRIAGRWKKLSKDFMGMGPKESFAAHTELISTVISDIEREAYFSGMYQDRDTWTGALVDGAASRLPHIMEYAGRLRGLGSGLLVSSALGPEDRGQLKALASVARAELKGFSTTFEPLLSEDTEKARRLGPQFNAMMDSFLSSLRMLDEAVLEAPGIDMAPLEFFERFTMSIRGALTLHTSIMGMIEERLAERMVFLNIFRNALYIATPACILFLFYFSFASYLSLRQSFLSLSEASERMRSGERGLRVPLSTRDEMADVLGAFNEMARSIEENESKLLDEVGEHKQTSAHLLKARETLQAYASELERKSQGQAEALVLAEDATSSRDEFFAKISHEMRTPLTCVIGVADLLNDNSLTDEQRKRVRMLLDSSEMLLLYINEILDYSKIQAGELSLEECPFDLRQKINSAVMPLSVIAHRKGLGFEVNIDEGLPSKIMGDPARIAQVLVNLLNNALKYTEAGGISLKVFRAESGDGAGGEGRVTFSVSDTGMGIPQEHLEDIFSPYRQVSDNPVNRSTGTGLGLTISKACVELMGGKLSATSQSGRGSTFSFSLGLRPATGEEASPSQPAPTFSAPSLKAARGPMGPHQLLLVDDNIINQKVYGTILRNSGLIVHSAMSGKEALAEIGETEFDLVLMDVLMPDMDGPEVCSIIREQEARADKPGRHIPVIALSASVTLETKERCIECGMDAFLEKPLRPDKLIATVRDHLRTTPATGS